MASEESAPTLLSDAQVREFIVRGVLTLPVSDLSPEFHRELHAESERMFDKGIALGNDIFPGIAGLKDVMESRTVRGALTSLLGEGYAMHPHRHMHNSSSQGEQTFHKGVHHHFPLHNGAGIFRDTPVHTQTRSAARSRASARAG